MRMWERFEVWIGRRMSEEVFKTVGEYRMIAEAKSAGIDLQLSSCGFAMMIPLSALNKDRNTID